MSCEMEDLGIDFCPYRGYGHDCEYWCGSGKDKTEETNNENARAKGEKL